MINIQWDNIIVYFEMPAWVRKFYIPENKMDANNVKAEKVSERLRSPLFQRWLSLSEVFI